MHAPMKKAHALACWAIEAHIPPPAEHHTTSPPRKKRPRTFNFYTQRCLCGTFVSTTIVTGHGGLLRRPSNSPSHAQTGRDGPRRPSPSLQEGGQRNSASPSSSLRRRHPRCLGARGRAAEAMGLIQSSSSSHKGKRAHIVAQLDRCVMENASGRPDTWICPINAVCVVL